jgi:chaperonin GroES
MDSGLITTDTIPAAVEGGAVPEDQGPQRLRVLDMMQMPNVAVHLSAEKLGNIGSRVVREYGIDKTSRADWEKNAKAAMDLALQVVEEKSYPWPKAANVKYPLMTTAAIQFAARAYPAIVSGRDVVKGKVIGEDPQGLKKARADRIARHMSYQLLDEMKEWEEDTDKLLHILPIVGCVFRKSYYDRAHGRNCSEMVHPDKMVVNYHAKSLDTAARVTQEFDLYPHEITERIRSGLYLEFSPGLSNKTDGDEDAPHLFLEQHRLLDLDEDDYPEPYCVTVHRDTSKVVRIVARYDEEGVFLNEKHEVAKIDPVSYFTKYGFIPAPDGSFYDVGFGHLLNPINEAVNTTLNQLLDAGHLANTGGGFIGKGLRMKGGAVRFAPGEYKPVDVAGQTVRDSIVPLQFPGPSPVLFQLLGLLIDAGKEVASVKDVLTGDTNGRAQTATTTLALIEQGLKVFTAIYKRVHRALKQELAKLYRLNRIYLPPQQYFTVLDQPEAVAQEDYADKDVDVIPVSDPTVVSDMQRLGRAQFLMELAKENPSLNGEEVTRRVLEAAQIEDVDKLISKQQPGPDPKMLETIHRIAIDKAKLETAEATAAANIQKTLADALLALTQAEAAAVGTDISVIAQQLEAIKAQFDMRQQASEAGDEGAADGGAVPGVEGAAGNPAGAAIPAGLPGIAQGGMGGGPGQAGSPGGMPGQMPGAQGLGGAGL